MKILSLHCDFIKFKPLKKALKEPEQLRKDQEKEHEVKEALVIFTAVEKQDESNPNLSKEYLENIKDIANQVKAEQIVLYPYAHLSPSLSSPDFALKTLEQAEKDLKKEKFKVSRAPFGYYKEFELKCKGHPLAELSRTINTEGGAATSKKGKSSGEEAVNEEERLQLVNKLSKIKMQAVRGENNLKSNVELGRDLDLYIVSEVVGPGLPLLTPKGTAIKREIERFIVDEELKQGYEHTSTPVMARSDLFKISGHWQHYKDSMFTFKVGDGDYALRPMTCPFQFVLYKRKPRSYKDLPKKYAEIATLYRQEQSGELRGLTRLWQFTLADGHIICTPEQLEFEFEKVLDLINHVMKTLGIKDVWYRFSKWDPKDKKKYIDNPVAWEKSQKMMKKILDKLKIKYKEAEGEAAFYGPKLDIQYKDVYGKEDTLLTVQIDFALPERFKLSYTDNDNQEKTAMVIHRSSSGCTERVIAYILEKTQGNLPTWLSPIQARVISFTDRNQKAAEKVLERLREAGIRADSDFTSSTVGEKVRNSELMKIPYLITIGDKEEEKKTIAVKKRGEKEKPQFGVKLDSFINDTCKEIKERK